MRLVATSYKQNDQSSVPFLKYKTFEANTCYQGVNGQKHNFFPKEHTCVLSQKCVQKCVLGLEG